MEISYRPGLLIPEIPIRSRFRDGKKRWAKPDVLMVNATSPVNLLVIELRRFVRGAIGSTIEGVY